MHKIVTDILDNKAAADSTLSRLLAAGFNQNNISLIMSQQARHTPFADAKTPDVYTETCLTAVGGILTTLLSALTVSGNLTAAGSPLLASGPIVPLLESASVMAGSLGGILIRTGFSIGDAARSIVELRRSRAVVIVHADSQDKVLSACAALQQSGMLANAA